MNHATWNTLLSSTQREIERLSVQKGGEYAGDSDRLENFKRNAALLGLRPEQVWAVYAGKHWDALMQYVKDLGSNTERVRAEPIEGRLDDLIVYCILMKGIVQEKIPAPLICVYTTPQPQMMQKIAEGLKDLTDEKGKKIVAAIPDEEKTVDWKEHIDLMKSSIEMNGSSA